MRVICENNPECQGFGYSKTEKYGQYFGCNFKRGGSDGSIITRGDDTRKGHDTYNCYMRKCWQKAFEE